MFPYLSQEQKDQARVLQGFVKEGDIVKVNGFVIQALRDLNVYIVQEQLLDNTFFMEEDSDLLHSRSWVDYLIEYDSTSIVVLEEQHCEIQYNVVPFSPSVKDVFYVARLLGHKCSDFTVEDIFLLALYRDMQLLDDKYDVKKVTDKRDVDSIKQMLKDIEPFHQEMVQQHYNYLKEQDEQPT